MASVRKKILEHVGHSGQLEPLGKMVSCWSFRLPSTEKRPTYLLGGNVVDP